MNQAAKIMQAGVLAVLLAGTAAQAEKTPGRGQYDARVREAHYVNGQVYAVRVSMTRATTVEFGPGEQIVSIVAGDTEAFQFESVPGNRVMAIKPVIRGAATNVTVYTNARSYYLSLAEGNSAFYVVRFNYPETHRASERSVKRTKSRKRYGISEKSHIAPVAIWDDGASTFFRFRSNAPLPAIFKVSKGRESAVNSTVMKGHVVRVSGVSRQWTVRLGDDEVCIVELVNE